MRNFIEQVERLGELRHISGADCHLEIGALTEVARKELSPPPALLFDDIPGYPRGFRVISGLYSTIKRLQVSLGIPGEMSRLDMVEWWRHKMAHIAPIAPVQVADGPVVENVWTGDEVNMLAFPAPLWHSDDGDRYIGTGCAVITRDPEDGQINLGCYRVAVIDERRVAVKISPRMHGAIHRNKYFEQGRPCPMAITLGQDPLLYLVAGMQVPHTMDEYSFAGYLRGTPVEVISGEYTGLPIPAHAEIVIEGELVQETVEEGPFGEFTGYYASGRFPCPIMHVRRVLFRNNPIVCGAPPYKPPDDTTFHLSLIRSGLIWNQLETAGVPDVKGVWCFEQGCNRMFVAVAIKQRYPGHARQAGLVATQCDASAYLGRYVIVVDEDIDPSNLDQVIWAVSTRSNPEHDIEVLRRCISGPLDPIIRPGQKGMNSRAVIDACRPWEWKDQFPRTVALGAELRESVLDRWGNALRGGAVPAGQKGR